MSLGTPVHGSHLPTTLGFAAAWPTSEWRSYPVIAAVSGGSDSVALLCLMLSAKQQDAVDGPAHPMQTLHVAHFNHAMRADSQRDAKFVQQLAMQLQLPFLGGVAQDELNSEADARAARYEFLEQAAAKVGARFIATGHTADDQAETILHHVVRGSGLAGLSGIPRTRALNDSVSIIRPLLALRREQLRTFLADTGQPFVDDATNEDNRFTRNRIRSELLPLLEENYNPQVVAALNRMGKLAESSQVELTNIAQQWMDQVVTFTSSGAVRISTETLRSANLSQHMIRELAILIWRRQRWPQQDMSFAKWDQIAGYANSHKLQKPIQLPGGVRMEQINDKVQLSRPEQVIVDATS